jgi:hypothetical protein
VRETSRRFSSVRARTTRPSWGESDRTDTTLHKTCGFGVFCAKLYHPADPTRGQRPRDAAEGDPTRAVGLELWGSDRSER